MKNFLFICLFAIFIAACNSNTSNTEIPTTDSTTVTTTTPEPTPQNELPEGYIKIAYPLEVVGTDDPDKTLENLKAAGFDVLTMGNPEAKKSVIVLEDGVLLEIYANESVTMGNYAVNFCVIDKSGNQIGSENMYYVESSSYSEKSNPHMNSTISIKDKTITIVSRDYDGKKLLKEEKEVFKINADGLAKA